MLSEKNGTSAEHHALSQLKKQGKLMEYNELITKMRQKYSINPTSVRACLAPKIADNFYKNKELLLKQDTKNRVKILKGLITGYNQDQLHACAKCKPNESAKINLTHSALYYFGEVICVSNKNIHIRENRTQKRYILEIPKWKTHGIKPSGPLTNKDILKIIELETGSKYISIEDYLSSPTRKIKGSYKHKDEYYQARMTPEQMIERRNLYRKRLETERQTKRHN